MIVTGTKNVAGMRKAARRMIDEEAEKVRLRYITPGYGQTATYIRKDEQAKKVAENPSIDPEEVPLIAAEVGITAPTLYEVAQVVLNMAYMWELKAAQIEAVRLAAKGEVDLANSQAEIDGIVEQARADFDLL